SGSITFISHSDANVSGRYKAQLAAQKAHKSGGVYDLVALEDKFFQKAMSAQSLRSAKARAVVVSPIGELRDPGYKAS
ncbi:MAG: hypothetical protein ACKO69_08050, partial [Limnohabitans sp.]